MTGHDDRRGQTAVIGIVLLVGLVAVGGVGILLLGGQINDESKTRAETERVEQAFLELGRDLNTVARTDSGERRIDLDLPDTADSAVRESASGTIWVNRTNFTTGKTDVLVKEPIGSIRYESDDGVTFAYQAGAVFRQSGNQTRVLSNPGFEYTLNRTGGNPTLTLPIITTVGPDSLPDGEVRARKLKTTSPVNDDVIVENDLVSVTVKSEWYIGWAEYFRSLAQTSGVADTSVSVNHDRQTATLDLIVPVSRPSVGAGIIGAAGADDFNFDNNIALDSYDSRDGDYDATKTSDIKVIVAGNLTLANNIQIDGDVEVGGTLKFENNADVTGNASYGSVDPDPPTTHVGGWFNNNSSVIDYDPVDGLIDARTIQVRRDNDNDSAPISGGRLDNCASTTCSVTLTGGNYYLEKLHLDNNDELTFDTNGETVNVVVNGTVSISKADINLDNSDGRVNVYINSEDPSAVDMVVDNADITIPGNDTTRLWWYADKDANAEFGGGNTVYHGVLFGPGTDTDPGLALNISQGGEYYGALVVDVNSLDNKMSLHYDKALIDAETVTAVSTVPRVTFLVATSYVVEVDDP